MWGNLNTDYSNLIKGITGNIYRITSGSMGFKANRLMGYPESHDE